MNGVRGRRSVVALSGGVDSSLSAWLMKERAEKFDVVHMQNWKDDAGACSKDEDLGVLMQVCLRLGVRLRVLDLSEEYWSRVFAAYLRQLQLGRTPNPDVYCNQQIKFGALMETVRAQGYERLVTGHYARIVEGDEGMELHKARDASKDQSYFLHLMTQDMLSCAHFPLGQWLKTDVRRAAETAGLANHDRKDSTGICFIGKRPYRDFICEYIKAGEGEIRHLDDDRVLGAHQGACLYTIGQRQGLGIGGKSDCAEQPWYVAGKNIERNIVYVVSGREHPALYRRSFQADELHWISGQAPETGRPYGCKLRYRQSDLPCRIRALDAEVCSVELEEPAFAVTPGQAFVLYSGTECLGGGVIL